MTTISNGGQSRSQSILKGNEISTLVLRVGKQSQSHQVTLHSYQTRQWHSTKRQFCCKSTSQFIPNCGSFRLYL